MLIKYLITALLLSVIKCFNIDTANTHWTFSTPSANSQFGYTVSLQEQEQKILVGAPFYEDGGFRPGGVFSCGFNSNNDCVKLDIETNEDPDAKEDYQRKEQMMGFSTSTDFNGNFMACAPRWIQNYTRAVNLHDQWFRGRCSLIDKDFKKKYTFSPCRAETAGNTNYGYCEAGFSSTGRQLSGTTPRFYVGAPGAINFKGALIELVGHGGGSKIRTMFTNQDRLNEVSSFMGYSISYGKFTSAGEVVGGAPRASELYGKVIIYSIDEANNRFTLLSNIENPDKQVGSYFGSSVLAVDLNNDGNDDLLVGAPYFTINQDEGRVYVFMNKKSTNFGGLDPQSFQLKGDEQPGGKFGTTLAKLGDINNDGYQDVVVGAPYLDNGKGAIFIYNGGKDGINPKYSQVIRASDLSLGNNFGSSLSAGMDVDNNQYFDFAVGAAESGKAYIFRSRPIITITDTITVNVTSVPIKKTCEDSKGNSYHCISLTTTLQFSGGEGVTDPFDVEITYSLDDLSVLFKRAFIEDDSKILQSVFSKNFTVTMGTPNIHTSVVYFAVRADPNFDIIKPIRISTKYKGYDKVGGCGGNPCPIIDIYGSNSNNIELIYLQECGTDTTCDTDLKVTGQLSLRRSEQQSEIIYGANDEVYFLILVENFGEAAYVSHMKVNCSSDLDIVGVDIDGESYPLWTSEDIDGQTLQMSFPLANPIAVNGSVNVIAKFSVGKLPRPTTKLYTFSAQAFSLGTDKDPLNDKTSIDIPTKVQTCIQIQGSAKPSQVVYKLNADQPPSINASVYDLGASVDYTFLVQNKGRKPVDTLAVDIDIGAEKEKTTLVYIVDLTIDGVKCEEQKLNTLNFTLIDPNAPKVTTDGGDGGGDTSNLRRRREIVENDKINCRTGICKTFKCSINRIDSNEHSVIKIATRIWSANLAELKIPTSDIITTVDVRFDGPNADQNIQKDGCVMEDQVGVTVQPGKSERTNDPVEWWIILLAVLGAVILLAIASAVLYKAGFFKRNRKIKEISGPNHEAHNPPKTNDSYDEEDDD